MRRSPESGCSSLTLRLWCSVRVSASTRIRTVSTHALKLANTSVGRIAASRQPLETNSIATEPGGGYRVGEGSTASSLLPDTRSSRRIALSVSS